MKISKTINTVYLTFTTVLPPFLVVGDKGCLPVIGNTAVTQSITSQFILPNSIGTSEAADLIMRMCVTHGLCCTKNLCNNMPFTNFGPSALLTDI